MGWQDDFWREERRWWEEIHRPDWRRLAWEMVSMEEMEQRHPGCCFDDSPMLTALERMKAVLRG
jgi:hypothetical protein